MSKLGTSRRRTPPAPVSAGPPKGARTACRGAQTIIKPIFGFKRKSYNFCPRANFGLPSIAADCRQGRRSTAPSVNAALMSGRGLICQVCASNAQATRCCNSVSAIAATRMMRCRCSASRSRAARSPPQCSITLRWLRNRKDRTLSGKCLGSGYLVPKPEAGR
jgi:hypothetical protein